jgi:lipoprotein-releasing system ATP-binding protein
MVESADAPSLVCRAITKSFIENGNVFSIFRGIDLEVSPGATLAIMGASGAGKSSLLTVMAGMDRPQSGQVFVGKVSLYDLPDAKLSVMRNRLFGYAHQFPRLLSNLTAGENVALPLILRGESRRQAMARSAEVLAEVNLTERIQHHPSELSGGEKQRVALARAIVGKPLFLMLDEPTGNLDQQNGQRLLDVLMDIHGRSHFSVIIVTHDPAIALRMGTVLTMDGGQLDSRPWAL